MEDLKCGFCHLGTEVESICGKLHHDSKKTAAHHKCMQYSADLVQYKFEHFGGFKIDKVENEIRRGRRLKCSICKNNKSRQGKWLGATSGCAIPSCSKTFHYYCAKLDDVALTKRMEVRYLQENTSIVMYRVFCSEAHYEQFKENKASLKNQHRQLVNNCSDEDAESESEEIPEVFSDSLNTQMEEDILCLSLLSPCHSLNNGESSTSEKGDAGKMFTKKSKIKEVTESAKCSSKNLFPTGANRIRETKGSAKSSPKTMCHTGANQPNGSPAKVSPAKAKPNIPKGKEKSSSEISNEENGFQSLSDSSASELENPFSRKPGKKNAEEDRQSLNHSKDQKQELNSDESKNSTQYAEKSNNGSKQGTSKETVESTGKRKTKQEAASQRKSPVSRKTAMSKGRDLEPNKTTEGGQRYIKAVLHVATSPSSVDEAIREEDETSNGQGYISDDEMVVETTGSTKGSVMQQKSSSSSPNHLPEMSSESEWEEMAQFPECAVAISNTTKVWPSKKNMIIQRAKEGFDVNHVAIWTTTNSFSDQFTDEYLPHLMRIITDMVRERRFKKLGSLLTNRVYQLTQMDSIKHMVDLPDEVVENIRKSLMKKLSREEINGEEVLFMDTKLNTLFLKLNDTVDRVCKIRNTLLPHAKEFLGHLFEWKESTASSAPLNQSDAEMEWKGIKNWMTHQQWNLSESSIYPSDDIFLAANKNQGIEELIVHQSPMGDNKRKVVFVRAMKEVVNYNMFIQELILSCVETEDTLIICHSVPVITRQSLVPMDLPKDTQVQVMSAFKPSNKRGISILVIHICNQKQQRSTTGQSQVSAIPCEDEITVCLEDINCMPDRKRRAVTEKARTSAQKRKRAA